MSFPTPDELMRLAIDTENNGGKPPPTVSPFDNDEVTLVDFSFSPKPIRFTADGETYECYPVLPITAMQTLVQTVRTGGVGDVDLEDPDAVARTLGKITGIFDALMYPESAQRFNARVLGVEALDLRAKRATELLEWITTSVLDPLTVDGPRHILAEIVERAQTALHGELTSTTTTVIPLDLKNQVIPIMHWILERYGLRPTQPPSSSSPGSLGEIDGTSSTGGVLTTTSSPSSSEPRSS
jgi:hypothetical protein